MGGPPQNIVVTNVTVSKSVVCQGYSANIYVTVENQGTLTQNVTLDINFSSNKVKLGTGPLDPGSSKTIALNVIPKAFLFEEVWRKPGGVPNGNIENLNLNGTGTSLKAMTGTITCGGLSLPGGIIELNCSDGTMKCFELLGPAFTAGKYGEGLYMLGTSFGSLCFLDDRGEYGELTVGTMPVSDIQIEGSNVTVTTENEVILLRRCSADFTLSKGEYTISVSAEPVLGETDTTDNICTDGTAIVAMVGDINTDGTVDIVDITRMAILFGSEIGDSRYNPNLDINNDGTIDMVDITTAALNFGRTDP
jgi:hypothetical protein